MSEPSFSVNFTGQYTVSATCAIGDLLVYATSLGFWQLATTAARALANSRTQGVALTAYGGSVVGAITYQSSGVVSSEVSGLGDGIVGLVRCSALGRMERVVSYTLGDDIIGYAEADGRVHLHLGLPWGDIVALTGGGASAINMRGLYAARPAAGSMGRLYFATDSALVFFDDGAAWQPHGLTQAFNSPPAASAFALTQTGSNATLIDDKGALLLSATRRIGTDDRILATYGTSGSGNPKTLTVGFELHMDSQGDITGGGFVNTWSMAGICYRVGNGWEGLHAYGNGGGFGLLMGAAATLTGGPSTNFATATPAIRDRMLWLRLVDNGVANGVNAMRWYYSVDGRNFYQCWRSHRSFSLASVDLGLVVNPYDTGVAMRVFDWTLS